jgi:Iap family predicted aminopeptidase
MLKILCENIKIYRKIQKIYIKILKNIEIIHIDTQNLSKIQKNTEKIHKIAVKNTEKCIKMHKITENIYKNTEKYSKYSTQKFHGLKKLFALEPQPRNIVRK